MSWWLTILCGVLTGALGTVCAVAVAAIAVQWHNVGTREGERAYTVVYLGLLGLVLGTILGVVIARVVAARPSPTFAAALGWSSAVVVGLGAVALTLSRLSAAPASASRAPRPVEDHRPASVPEAEVEAPHVAYARKRLAELCAFTPSTPLALWLAYSRGNDAAEVKAFALRAIAARPTLLPDLNALLARPGCVAALRYLEEEMRPVPDDVLAGVRAALQQIPDLLRRSFRDPSGVHADTGLHDVRVALAVVDKLGAQRACLRPEIEELAKTFVEAPRVRRVSRGSRFVEQKIKTFDAERLLAAWLQ